MPNLTRRDFVTASSLAALGAALPARAAQPESKPGVIPDAAAHRGPVCISSGNGMRAVARAMDLSTQGYDPADCIVQGVRIVEDDPEDMSVGLGGLPNEEGIVELDASVMHGPTHKSGAVGGCRNIKNVAMVALEILRRTNHCLIVGDGARRFAVELGFPEENLLTERARQQWLKWKANLGKGDFWLNDDETDETTGKQWDGKKIAAARAMEQISTTGTIHCSIVDSKSNIASCTSTSGLSWKIPGRVGDSPIIGAGNYCDNQVGAGGCTGRGESAIVNLSAYCIVRAMESGMTPEQACLDAARRMMDRTKEKRLKGPDGQPLFDVSFYAIRKDGAYGAACLKPGATFAVHDGTEARLLKCTPLLT